MVALAALLLLVAIALGRAHWQIRQLTASLPGKDDIEALLDTADNPGKLSVIHTPTQIGATGAVIAYPAFLLQWNDGRSFLIDAGMRAARAAEFGEFLERVAGAEPLTALASVGEQLGDALMSVRGVALTHLHSDHVDGLPSLCSSGDQSIVVHQTQWQTKHQNYSTSDSHELLVNTKCLHRKVLQSDENLLAVPGFPGLAAYSAGGHTPGSTIFFAAIDTEIWIIAGDIANDMKSIDRNLPKPLAYSLFLTPEDRGRLEDLRLWLSSLDSEPNMTVVISHDLEAISRTGMPVWPVDAANIPVD